MEVCGRSRSEPHCCTPERVAASGDVISHKALGSVWFCAGCLHPRPRSAVPQQALHPPAQKMTTVSYSRCVCFKMHWSLVGFIWSSINAGNGKWQVPGLCSAPFRIVYSKIGDYKSLKATDFLLMNALCQHSGLCSYISSANLAQNLSRREPSPCRLLTFAACEDSLVAQ